MIHQGQKEAHKSLLVGMYVRPSARKSGVGRRLVETIVEFARQRVELIQLSVVSDNEQARRLYGRLGFLEYGIEKKALKQDGRYYDEGPHGKGPEGGLKFRHHRHRAHRRPQGRAEPSVSLRPPARNTTGAAAGRL